jgi:hypothetical protein
VSAVPGRHIVLALAADERNQRHVMLVSEAVDGLGEAVGQ